MKIRMLVVALLMVIILSGIARPVQAVVEPQAVAGVSATWCFDTVIWKFKVTVTVTAAGGPYAVGYLPGDPGIKWEPADPSKVIQVGTLSTGQATTFNPTSNVITPVVQISGFWDKGITLILWLSFDSQSKVINTCLYPLPTSPAPDGKAAAAALTASSCPEPPADGGMATLIDNAPMLWAPDATATTGVTLEAGKTARVMAHDENGFTRLLWACGELWIEDRFIVVN